MIFNYIERSVTRKAHLVNLLYCAKAQSIDTLAINLECTPLTVIADIEYLKSELDIPIVQKNDFYQVLPTQKENLQSYLKKVYQTSLFLQFLSYFMITDKPKFSDFIESQHVSIAKGYRVREEIIEYLKSIHLEVIDNTVSGNTLLIRFLIAEYDRTFGMNILNPSSEIKDKCNKVLNTIERNMNIQFSKHERELYLLLITTSVTKNIPNAAIDFNLAEIRGVNSKFYPKCYINLVKKEFSSLWDQELRKQELHFTILAFVVSNSHLFDKSVDPEQRKIYEEEFLKIPEVNLLISKITENFKIRKKMLPYFYTTVYSFLSDILFRLQPIFAYPLYNDNEAKTHIFYKLSRIIEDWNIYNMDIERYHILDFCNRLAPILSPNLYKKIVIVTEEIIDGNFLRDYLQMMIEDIEIVVQKDITDIKQIEDTNSFFIIDKELTIPFAPVSVENVSFIFFPVREKAVFKIINKVFK